MLRDILGSKIIELNDLDEKSLSMAVKEVLQEDKKPETKEEWFTGLQQVEESLCTLKQPMQESINY